MKKLVACFLLLISFAVAQDQQRPTGGPQSQPPGQSQSPAPTPTSSSSKQSPKADADVQALFTDPDAKEVAVFKCAAFQNPKAVGTTSASYDAGCPLEEIYGSTVLRSQRGQSNIVPSQRLADVLAKYVNQPLKTGQNKPTQLSTALLQLLQYAYNDEAIFPENVSYAIIHLVDRQGAVGEAANAKDSGAKTTIPAQKGARSASKAGKPTAGNSKAAPSADKPDPTSQPNANSTNSQPIDRWILAHRTRNIIELSEDTRIFGVKSLAVIFVHVNATINADSDPETQFGDVAYRVIAKAKLPQNISDLLGLLQVAVGLFNATAQETRVSYIGFGLITTVPTPSDVTIFGVESNAGTGPNRRGLQLVGQSRKYDNEGKYWWDISLGVPVNKLSLVTFSQDNQTFTPKTINKQSVYGMVNIFLHPVDLKHVEYIPHPVVGLGLTGRPGENFMFGGAWGIPQLQGFFGRAYAARTVPNNGGEQHYKHDWTYGINLPILSAIKQLTAQKSKSDSTSSTKQSKNSTK